MDVFRTIERIINEALEKLPTEIRHYLWSTADGWEYRGDGYVIKIDLRIE